MEISGDTKFKKGDWIRSTKYDNLKIKVEEIYYSNTRFEPAYKSGGRVLYESEAEKWLPEQKEWVIEVTNNQERFEVFMWDSKLHTEKVNNVEPFVFSYPSWVKESQNDTTK